MPRDAVFKVDDLSRFRFETERRSIEGAPAGKNKFSDAGDRGREAQNPRDAVLSDLARQWFDSLPPHLRPFTMCRQYPRICNRLALCWPDRALTERIFESVLEDRRGTRKGFRREIILELVALRDYFVIDLGRA
jgi:hypothetical protein